MKTCVALNKLQEEVDEMTLVCTKDELYNSNVYVKIQDKYYPVKNIKTKFNVNGSGKTDVIIVVSV